MTLNFHAGDVWSQITAVVESAGRTYAAISFIGQDAPDLLPLGESDVLLVNAKDSCVRSHATNPYALEEFTKRGVVVYSSDRLHAKVIATDQHAVVGSANASANSTRSSEAVIITKGLQDRKQIRDFVKREIAENGFKLNQEKLNELKRIFDEAPQPETGIPGVNNPASQVTGFPWALGPVYLVEDVGSDLTDDEESALLEGRSRETGFSLSVAQSNELGEPFEVGDIVIFCDEFTVRAPMYVDSAEIAMDSDPSRKGQIMQQKIKHRRSYARSGMKNRYDFENHSFRELMEELEESSGFMELKGAQRDNLLRVWFPELAHEDVALNG